MTLQARKKSLQTKESTYTAGLKSKPTHFGVKICNLALSQPETLFGYLRNKRSIYTSQFTVDISVFSFFSLNVVISTILFCWVLNFA